MHKSVAVPSYTKTVGYQAGLLGGIAMIVSIFLMLTEHGTRQAVVDAEDHDRQVMLNQVLPESMYDNNPLTTTIQLDGNPFGGNPTIFIAARDGKFTGAAFETIAHGYSGDIVLLLAVHENGELSGVRTISHAETPGLGDKIEAAKSDWITHFKGMSLNNLSEKEWHVKKDGGHFDQFTGATITPRAVVKAIHEALQIYRQQESTIATKAQTLIAQKKESKG